MNELETFIKGYPIPAVAFSDYENEAVVALLGNRLFSEALTYEDLFLGKGYFVKNAPDAVTAIWEHNRLMENYFKISVDASLFLALIVNNKRDAIIYFSFAAFKAKRMGVRNITLYFLSEHVFPYGVFTEEQRMAIWESQWKMEEFAEDGILSDQEQWRELLRGTDDKLKAIVSFSDDEERELTQLEASSIGAISNPREIEGRMFFWLGKRYVNTSLEDYAKLKK